MPFPAHQKPFLWYTEHDKILDKFAFRTWMEEDSPYTIDVTYERGRGYAALLYDEQSKPLWRSESKSTAAEARAHGEGFATTYRWLGQRKVAGMADPCAQITYGGGTP